MSGRQSPSTSSRSRSSTTASLRSDSSREYYATNPQLLLSPSVPISNLPDTTTTSSGWSSTNTVVSESFQSAHSLATVRPHRSSSSASSSSSQSSSSLRPSNPQFVINEPTDDPSTPTKLPLLVVGEARSRASTFGGVPLPPSPLAPLLTPTAHLSDLPLNRSRSDSFSSLSSSLQLGGGSFGERRPKLLAGIKGAALFGLSLLGLYVLLKGLLPPIDEKDREFVKLPKSFDDLKALNGVLQVYKDRHYWRVLGCYTTVYLFLQAFSIPGSMYLSILGGAMYGVLMALPLVCFCVSTGALLCYFISAALGPALLLNSVKWQHRVDAWTARIAGHGDNLISYLIVLRIAPLPPHWVVNVVAPHLGISVWTFWISTFFGISGVSYIHTQIGTTLDQMTSSSDFHLISVRPSPRSSFRANYSQWQNGLGLGGIIVAVLIPVFLRRHFKKDLEEAAIDDEVLLEHEGERDPLYVDDEEERYEEGQGANGRVAGERFGIGEDEEDEEDEEEEEERRERKGDKARRVLGVGADEAQGVWEADRR